jgi:hypothetical protein
MTICCRNSFILGDTGTSITENDGAEVNALTLVSPVLQTNGQVQWH